MYEARPQYCCEPSFTDTFQLNLFKFLDKRRMDQPNRILINGNFFVNKHFFFFLYLKKVNYI